MIANARFSKSLCVDYSMPKMNGANFVDYFLYFALPGFGHGFRLIDLISSALYDKCMLKTCQREV